MSKVKGLKEIFIVVSCVQVDIVSLEPQTSEWREKNEAKVSYVLEKYDSEDVLFDEMSDDGLTRSVFIMQGTKVALEKDFRGYVMSKGDMVLVPEIDDETMEILEIRHIEDGIEYLVQYMSIVDTITEELLV